MQNKFPDACDHCGRPFIYQRITEHNRRVLELLITGMSNKEIADAMNPPIAVRTVKAHVARLMRILNVKNRVQLAFKYAQPMTRIALGLEELPPQPLKDLPIENGAD